jgi:acyl-CoA reductase-like NAD-dependent aldehyde dehydrogenase
MQLQLLINGKLETGGLLLDVIDPATGEVFAKCARATASQANAAVNAAHDAFNAWSKTPLRERQACLVKAAEAVEQHRDELAELLTRENGKPLAEASAEVAGAAYLLRHYSGVDIPVEVIDDSPQRRVELRREPLGVVAAILPWNFPVFMAAAKIAQALLAGNTIVVKPAPTTPLATLALGEKLKDVLPDGVLNIIVDANDLGEVLTAHPLVRKVSFTGSTVTGIKVMNAASATLKRVTLELGGNDAGIVLDDCDPDEIAPKLFWAAFSNNGQICAAVKRLFVHESLHDALCESLAAIAQKVVVGPGLDQGTQLGPLQNRMQFERVKDLIETSRQDGAIIAGGAALERPGYFMRPTIVRDLPDDARLIKEEQFGPVLPIIKYASLDDAIARANATSYGLGASVWSNDLARANAVAERLEAGTVWINQHADVSPAIPFAGSKMSGIGSEYAEDGLNGLTQIKVVNVLKA